MVFSSIPFLYYFLPCTILAYFLTPKKGKNATLLLCSLIFYAWSEPRFVFIMLFTILQGYLFGLGIERHKDRLGKCLLAVSVIISLSVLGVCKYADFFIENFNTATGLSIPFLRIALPVGISFYTFQIISYVVDVYRREVPAQRNFITLAAYIAMFPQLIAGPIVRYRDIEKQLQERTHSFALAAEGTTRFLIGLSKKVLLANNLAALCELYKNTTEPSVLFAWMYAIAYTLHIYFDFSGYSDMAIGLGKLFGFTFEENFRYPYISKSITEFWRRWHISLGSWFRDYVYIPLGGNRKGQARWFLNILIVWMLTGFWHGASWNFVLWGLFYALLLILEKLGFSKVLKKLPVLAHLYVILMVILGFVLFDAVNLAQAGNTLSAMFGLQGLPVASVPALYYLRSYAPLLIMSIFFSTPAFRILIQKLSKKTWISNLIAWIKPLILLALLLIATGYLVDGSYNPFLYFRF